MRVRRRGEADRGERHDCNERQSEQHERRSAFAARPGEPDQTGRSQTKDANGKDDTIAITGIDRRHSSHWSPRIMPFAVIIWAVRQAMPTDLRRAGALAGLVAGALSATGYALHCVDDSVPFIALWYGGTIALCTLVRGFAPFVRTSSMRLSGTARLRRRWVAPSIVCTPSLPLTR